MQNDKAFVRDILESMRQAALHGLPDPDSTVPLPAPRHVPIHRAAHAKPRRMIVRHGSDSTTFAW